MKVCAAGTVMVTLHQMLILEISVLIRVGRDINVTPVSKGRCNVQVTLITNEILVHSAFKTILYCM